MVVCRLQEQEKAWGHTAKDLELWVEREVQFVKSGFGNAQHNKTPELCFVNRYLAEHAATDAKVMVGSKERLATNPGTIQDAMRHLRRAPSNTMSGVNPSALATCHSHHPYCTDQSYMVDNGHTATPE